MIGRLFRFWELLAMSVEIEILPTKGLSSADRIVHLWSELLGEEKSGLLGDSPRLVEAETREPITSNSKFPIMGKNYFFELAVENTLSLGIDFSSQYYDEKEFVLDYARNLNSEAQAELVRKWRKSGYLISLESLGGRGPHESSLFITLAKALAYECAGYIVLEHDCYNLPVGVYNLEQLRDLNVTF